MEALVLIGFIAIMLLLGLLLKRIETKYGVNRATATKPVKKIERWIGWTIVTGLIVIMILSVNGLAINYINVLLFFGIVALLQTVFEWSQVRNTQRSVISLALTIVFVLSLLGLVEVAQWALANL
ncbi:hypothetical protein BBH88_04960 [Planococcus antarcticus DSM 14505]|uniref:DUF4181 domain-containing protein n=1 Tax=Planococcus antarcticus DSM 14505 TaxID=1185653 RepID=A0ABM6D2Z9_9BACL|nr:DUF4181 domain-containing protein [Planococcus antarcticus]ANU09692.1 hypothetical protein BBH88_04960 [Planococcus antarcticus DSM 14505]